MVVRDLENHLIGLKTQCLWVTLTPIPGLHGQGLLTLSEEIAFTAQPKINWHTHIFKFCQSIFCLPHSPKFSDLFDLCLHWVSVTMANKFKIKTVSQPIIYFYKKLCLRLHEGFGLKCQPYPRKKNLPCCTKDSLVCVCGRIVDVIFRKEDILSPTDSCKAP